MKINWLKERDERFQRNEKLEALLSTLGPSLELAEASLLTNKCVNESLKPNIYIVGCPRAGTTLLMQHLASSKLFSYPTNFLSRFYASPLLGAKLQKMLFDRDYQYRDELGLASSIEDIDFESDLGKTKGALSPNVFWYFWYNNFNFSELAYLNERQWNVSNVAGFRKTMAALQEEYQQPFALKAMIMNWNLEQFARDIPESIFIWLKRDRYQTAESILKARVHYSGSIESWWSFKPPEYKQICKLAPKVQVACFILSIEKALTRAFKKINTDRYIVLDYDQLCSKPTVLNDKLTSIYGKHGLDLHFSKTNSSYLEKILSNNDLETTWSEPFKVAESYIT